MDLQAALIMQKGLGGKRKQPWKLVASPSLPPKAMQENC